MMYDACEPSFSSVVCCVCTYKTRYCTSTVQYSYSTYFLETLVREQQEASSTVVRTIITLYKKLQLTASAVLWNYVWCAIDADPSRTHSRESSSDSLWTTGGEQQPAAKRQGVFCWEIWDDGVRRHEKIKSLRYRGNDLPHNQ